MNKQIIIDVHRTSRASDCSEHVTWTILTFTATPSSRCFLKRCIYIFLAALVFVAVHRFSLVAASKDYRLVAVYGLLFWPSTGSVVVAHRLSYSVACGLFPDQGLNLCPPALAGGFLATGPPGKTSSVQLSRSVVSDSLQPHGLQHTRPPCPSPTPGVYLNSCPLSRCCHPTISSSVIPFSCHLQSFPASGSFPMSQFFTSGGQSIGAYLRSKSA